MLRSQTCTTVVTGKRWRPLEGVRGAPVTSERPRDAVVDPELVAVRAAASAGERSPRDRCACRYRKRLVGEQARDRQRRRTGDDERPRRTPRIEHRAGRRVSRPHLEVVGARIREVSTSRCSTSSNPVPSSTWSRRTRRTCRCTDRCHRSPSRSRSHAIPPPPVMRDSATCRSARVPAERRSRLVRPVATHRTSRSIPRSAAQTWKLYVPGTVGRQTHELLVLQSWPSDQDDPSLTKNLKVYGAVPPIAAAVHVTGVFAVTGNDTFAEKADTVSGAVPVTRTGPTPSQAS